MKIFLIGMPGAGKSTLGRPLANALNLPFVDLDKEVEKQEQKSIPELFEKRGEEYFRKSEAAVLKSWAESGREFVMATGGGAPCYHSGIDVINHNGLSVFLDITVEELVNRISQQSGRPLLSTDDMNEKTSRLSTLYHERRSCYQKAKITLENPSLPRLLEAVYLKR